MSLARVSSIVPEGNKPNSAKMAAMVADRFRVRCGEMSCDFGRLAQNRHQPPDRVDYGDTSPAIERSRLFFAVAERRNSLSRG